MRSSLLMSVAATGVLAALLGVASCSGNSGYNSPSAPMPPSSSPGSPASVTVSIVGFSGNAAFQPNPVKASAGDTIAFRNADSNMHHIVLDDGSDLGLLSPGATSAAMRINGSAVNFHCLLHPTMVGSINGTAAPEPPPCMNPGYCD